MLVEGFKDRNGCDGRRAEKPRQTHNNIAFHDCYCNHLDYGFSHWLQMHDQYQNGFLPFAGSAQEQPNKIMEILSVISQLKQELENKQQQDANKKRK